MVWWVVFATQEQVWNPRFHIKVWKLLKVYLDIHKKSQNGVHLYLGSMSPAADK